MNGNGDRAVTRAELKKELVTTRAELKEELATTRAELKEELDNHRRETSLEIARAMNFVVERLGGQMERMREDMVRMREDLGAEIARSARANAEELRDHINALDDRYRDLPGRVAALEREHEAHRSDLRLHKKPRRSRKG